MRKFGLIGYPLSHSFSPKYFADKWSDMQLEGCEYKTYPIERIEDLSELIDQGLEGINVTIPYKQEVIPHLDFISAEALAVGAVNTIKVVEGKLVGYNTDVYGLKQSLLDLLGEAKVERALVLGTGGAALAAQYVLRDMKIEHTLISRNKPYTTYGELDEEMIKKHKLIINTTPLGMYPREDHCPDIPYDHISASHFAIDLIYNPKKTIFLTKAENQGAKIANGLQMLHAQADKAWEIWQSPVF